MKRPMRVRMIKHKQDRPSSGQEVSVEWIEMKYLARFPFGSKELIVPPWVVLSCASLAALGTAYGGWLYHSDPGHACDHTGPDSGFRR